MLIGFATKKNFRITGTGFVIAKKCFDFDIIFMKLFKLKNLKVLATRVNTKLTQRRYFCPINKTSINWTHFHT